MVWLTHPSYERIGASGRGDQAFWTAESKISVWLAHPAYEKIGASDCGDLDMCGTHTHVGPHRAREAPMMRVFELMNPRFWCG